MTYQVEIRDLANRRFASSSPDFRINGLGTCKHTEAVLLHLEARFPKLYREATKTGSDRVDIVPGAGDRLQVERGLAKMPPSARALFDSEGILLPEITPDEALEALRKSRSPRLRLSQEVETWLKNLRLKEERVILRRDYERKVQSGEFPQHETRLPLFPYQREGMLHLAFGQRAMIADEMGLGKTVQAIAAAALLRRLGNANRVLVVSPASLKTEWEEQIEKFTGLDLQIVFGNRKQRVEAYSSPAFFNLVNYEQVRSDALDINERMQPDIVILDEAQRIKNWSSKTARAVKRLRGSYAFVLTGTPIENRIDELYSILDFLDPSILGPLFRFNREYYQLDERGRPSGYKNLHLLRERVNPIILRRRKTDVETELPARTDRNYFVPMSRVQEELHEDFRATAARLIAASKRRPLRQKEQEILMMTLAKMRMVCDTPYIIDPEDRTCPKLKELEKIFDDCLAEPDVKIIVFSEWVRMLELVRDFLRQKKIGFGWHTGSVPQKKRRAEIRAFKSDPDCRVFLCSESGGVGLNLQNASVVINCDLPWNPAKLEQRIARAWRKQQTRPVTVINLISEKTIEHGMLDTIAAKQGLAEGVLDGVGNLSEVSLRRGGQTFLKRLEQALMPGAKHAEKTQAAPPPPADIPLALARRFASELGPTLVSCEERFPAEGDQSILLVVVDGDSNSLSSRVRNIADKLLSSSDSNGAQPSDLAIEVIDRASLEALKRLEAAGLVKSTIRASRPLDATEVDEPPPLSAEEQARMMDLRKKAARQKKMAALLHDGGFADEALPAFRDAVCLTGRALAVEHRLPEPRDATEAVAPRFASFIGERISSIRTALIDGKDIADALKAL